MKFYALAVGQTEDSGIVQDGVQVLYPVGVHRPVKHYPLLFLRVGVARVIPHYFCRKPVNPDLILLIINPKQFLYVYTFRVQGHLLNPIQIFVIFFHIIKFFIIMLLHKF